MKLINELHISGRVGTEPEQKGNGPTRFRLAHGGGKRKDGSEWPTQWFSVVCWDAKAVADVRKGAFVEVWGKLRDATWTAKDGSKRAAVEIVAESIQVEEKPLTPAYPAKGAVKNVHGVEVSDDDLPW
jgi:single-strand DNA-binding protein